MASGTKNRVNWKRLLLNWLAIAIGIVIAAKTNNGISYGDDYTVLFVVTVVLSFLNYLLKPILILFTLPFIVLSLGLGLWILNALLFSLMSYLVNGFYVAGFGPALWGALWVSLASFFLGRTRKTLGNSTVRMNTQNRSEPTHGAFNHPTRKQNLSESKDDVIDI